MVVAILLSLAASFCTATSSVCQRMGARSLDAREPGVIVDDAMVWPTPFYFNPAPPTAEAKEKQLRK